MDECLLDACETSKDTGSPGNNLIVLQIDGCGLPFGYWELNQFCTRTGSVVYLFQTGSFYEALAALELSYRLGCNSQRFACLCLLPAGIRVMCHYTWPANAFYCWAISLVHTFLIWGFVGVGVGGSSGREQMQGLKLSVHLWTILLAIQWISNLKKYVLYFISVNLIVKNGEKEYIRLLEKHWFVKYSEYQLSKCTCVQTHM